MTRLAADGSCPVIPEGPSYLMEEGKDRVKERKRKTRARRKVDEVAIDKKLSIVALLTV